MPLLPPCRVASALPSISIGPVAASWVYVRASRVIVPVIRYGSYFILVYLDFGCKFTKKFCISSILRPKSDDMASFCHHRGTEAQSINLPHGNSVPLCPLSAPPPTPPFFDLKVQSVALQCREGGVKSKSRAHPFGCLGGYFSSECVEMCYFTFAACSSSSMRVSQKPAI